LLDSFFFFHFRHADLLGSMGGGASRATSSSFSPFLAIYILFCLPTPHLYSPTSILNPQYLFDREESEYGSFGMIPPKVVNETEVTAVLAKQAEIAAVTTKAACE
jgi:hypothetical protein